MAEHFDADKFTLWTTNLFLLDGLVYGSHLFEVELSSQYYYICKAGIELECLGIADIELCLEVYLLTNAVAVVEHCHICGDDS